MTSRLAALLLLVVAACGPSVPSEYEPAVGDVLFQALPPTPLVDTIEGATGSPFSHCGIVGSIDGRFFVLEAFQTVRWTPLESWLDRGRSGAFSVYRWREDAVDRVPEVLAAAEAYLGLPYDFRYDLDDEAIYCSELIFKAWRTVTGDDMGRLVSLGELDWQPYEQVIRRMEDGELPLDRVMITPIDLARAPQLEPVLHHGW